MKKYQRLHKWVEVSDGEVLITVDPGGRISIPVELRERLGFPSGTVMLLDLSGPKDVLTLRKLDTGCVVCGKLERGRMINGKNVCPECLEKLAWNPLKEVSRLW